MQHGFGDSCLMWMSNGSESPAVVLAKNGFDVWLGNSRGNKFSRLHKTLDPDSHPEYWDFTFEEKGCKDTKAFINLVKHSTGADKVTYVGGSQGAAMMFYALAQDDQWFKDNINLFVAVCPVIKPGEKANQFLKKLANSEWFNNILDSSGILEMTPATKFINKFHLAALKVRFYFY